MSDRIVVKKGANVVEAWEAADAEVMNLQRQGKIQAAQRLSAELACVRHDNAEAVYRILEQFSQGLL